MSTAPSTETIDAKQQQDPLQVLTQQIGEAAAVLVKRHRAAIQAVVQAVNHADDWNDHLPHEAGWKSDHRPHENTEGEYDQNPVTVAINAIPDEVFEGIDGVAPDNALLRDVVSQLAASCQPRNLETFSVLHALHAKQAMVALCAELDIPARDDAIVDNLTIALDTALGSRSLAG